MKLHANAALSLNKRRLLCQRVVEQEWTLTKAAEAAEVSVRCARKWVGRYRAVGELGLLDRPSTPERIANRTCERRIHAIAALRRLRFTGPEIAETLAMPLSTVSGILQRIGKDTQKHAGPPPVTHQKRIIRPELVGQDVDLFLRGERPEGFAGHAPRRELADGEDQE